MRIAVIGAGIVGVTTAYELAADGHEVTVFERRPGVAAEASFAIGGLLGPGAAVSRAIPGLTRGVFERMGGSRRTVRLGMGALGAVPWLWRSLLAGRAPANARNRTHVYRLAQFSRTRMDALAASLQLQFEQARGSLVLWRSARELAAARRGLGVLEELGVTHEVVDADRARELEPGLHAQAPLQAALRLPQDGVGNCRQFAHLLKAQAQLRGARFEFDATVRALQSHGDLQLAWQHADGARPLQTGAFDRVVVCAGHEAGRLLAPTGLRLPLLQVHGYSLTAPLRRIETESDIGPRAAVVDERHNVAITRLGQRVRVAGITEIGGRDGHLSDAAVGTLYKVLQDWFPGVADLSRAQHWKGARPVLPDGPPIVGPVGADGVWLNVGHGALGWTLASGSARLVADLIGGRAPEVDPAGFGLERLR